MRRVLVVLLLASACSEREPPPPPPLPRASVTTPWVAARRAEDSALLEMPAHIEAAPQARGAISPPYPARVVRVLTRPGERVAARTPVVEVLMPQLVTAAGALGAARTRAEAYAKRKAQLEALRAEGLARVAELAEAETRLAEARADEQTALATIRAAGLSPDEAARILAQGGVTILRSPVEGVVTELEAVVGETRQPGEPPLARVVGTGATRVVARVSQRLPAGARFELALSGQAAVPLRLVSQAPVVDPRDGTTATWLEPSDGARLVAGAVGRLRVLLPAGSRAVVVPATAVGSAAGRSLVVTRAGRVEVRLLASSGADALVEGALIAGDLVAAEAGAVDGGGA